MVIAFALVVLAVVTVVSFRLSWAAHDLPFAAMFLILGLIFGKVVLVACAVAMAVLSGILMLNRHKNGRPVWKD